MKLKRDFPGMFDVAKGILILVVILGHQNGFFYSTLQVNHPVMVLPSSAAVNNTGKIFFIVSSFLNLVLGQFMANGHITYIFGVMTHPLQRVRQPLLASQ